MEGLGGVGILASDVGRNAGGDDATDGALDAAIRRQIGHGAAEGVGIEGDEPGPAAEEGDGEGQAKDEEENPGEERAPERRATVSRHWRFPAWLASRVAGKTARAPGRRRGVAGAGRAPAIRGR